MKMIITASMKACAEARPSEGRAYEGIDEDRVDQVGCGFTRPSVGEDVDLAKRLEAGDHVHDEQRRTAWATTSGT